MIKILAIQIVTGGGGPVASCSVTPGAVEKMVVSPTSDLWPGPKDHRGHRALSRSDVEQLLTRKDISLRVGTFWRMAYETAARSAELLLGSPVAGNLLGLSQLWVTSPAAWAHHPRLSRCLRPDNAGRIAETLIVRHAMESLVFILNNAR
jgi:hypothetical protein